MNPAIFDRPSGAGALLGVGDIVTPTAGYSLRYLSIKYFGQPVVRVRKDVVGSPEQDFTPSQLTDGTLATFLGANDGLVSKWYDQFGSNDAVQTTAAEQPKIWDSTTGLVTENGRPAVDFDGVDDYFNFTTPTTLSDEFFITTALNSNPSGQWGMLLNDQTSASDRIRLYSNGNIDIRINSSTYTYSSAYTPNTQEILTIERDSLDSLEIYVDGTSQGSNTDAADWTGILGYLGSNQNQSSGQFYTGTFQELIIYNTDQSANRTKIEDNINDYYDIY